MEAVAGNKYDFGYILTETEIRRIISLIKEQFEKTSSNLPIEEKYRIVYKNGTIAKNLTLDNILEEENYGSGKITNLSAIIEKKDQKKSSDQSFDEEDDSEQEIIKLHFNNTDDSPLGENYYSISYYVKGTTRDWVFTTSSMLDERILKVKKQNYIASYLKSTSLFGFGFLWFFFFIFIAAMTSNDVSLEDYAVNRPGLENEIITKLEALKDTNSFKSSIDAVIGIKLIEEQEKKRNKVIVEKWENDRQEWYSTQLKDNSNSFWSDLPWYLRAIIVFILPIIVFYFLRSFYLNNYSHYNFIWGEYEVEYNKKRKKLNYVTNVVIGGIIISFIGGILANLF